MPTNAALPAITGLTPLPGGEEQSQQFQLRSQANGAQFFAMDAETLHSVETGRSTPGIVQDTSYDQALQQGQPLGTISPPLECWRCRAPRALQQRTCTRLVLSSW